MQRTTRAFVLLGALPLLLAAALDAAGDPDPLDPRRDVASLVPEVCQVVVEGPGLSAFLDRGLDDPLVASLLGSPLGEALLAEGGAAPGELLGRAEELLGRAPLPALASLTRRGAALGVSLGYGGPKTVLILLGDDGAETKAVLAAAFEALERRFEIPGALAEPHRRRAGAALWALGDDLCVARRDALLVLANDGDLLRDVLELAADAESRGRLANESFRASRADAGATDLLRAWVDLEALEALPGARRKLERLRAFEREPAVQALLGPGVAAVGGASRLSASLDLRDRGLGLRLTVEGGPSPAAVLRPGARPALAPPPPLTSSADVAHALLYRDFAALFQRRAELFPPKALPGFAKAISDLAVFFGGRDLGEDVLPGYSPWLEVVSRPLTYDTGREPEIPLPGVAVIARLASEDTGEELVAAFQSLLGLMNVDRAQEERPALRMRLALEGDVQLTTARFPAPAPGDGVDLSYNLQPALAVVGDCAVLGTHESLVRELVRELVPVVAAEAEGGGARSASAPAESLRLDGRAVARYLADNADALVMGKVLDEGASFEDARGEVDGLRLFCETIAGVGLEIRYPTEARCELSLELSLVGDGEDRR